MENKIPPLNWQSELKDKLGIISIDNDFMLFDNAHILPAFKYPFKVDVTTAMICLRGSTKGYLNMKPTLTQAPCFNVILADQIMQYEEISDDFEGLFIVLSKKFTDSLFSSASDRMSLFLSVKSRSSFPLSNEELELMKTYYGIFHKIVSQKENPNRLEIVKHLTLAFFYLTGSEMHNHHKEEKKSKQDVLLESFLSFIQKHHKEERSVDFYADKLCLTPKYLSTVIRQTSGKTAGEWIDEYVVLEAKALLKSTKMTIQQISDELNFPSQSFFGKYFKRLAGVSPKEYKRI